jgi:hypothetical protein
MSTPVTATLFAGMPVWGWRGRYGRAHAFHIVKSYAEASLCGTAPRPTVLGAPSRKRCKRCLAILAEGPDGRAVHQDAIRFRAQGE